MALNREMSDLPQSKEVIRNLSGKARLIGWAGAWFIRLLSLTYRWRLHDPEGIAYSEPGQPLIWIFWHNRIFVVPPLYRKYLHKHRGAVLSSASKDGEIIASIVARFGCASVRGSSSRRGATAMLGLIDWVKEGYDVAIVPDGPRGPRYRLGSGVVKLASVTGALILPIRVEYGSWWTFRSWDRFRLPKPFTTVDVWLGPCASVSQELEEADFESERVRIETLLNPDHETD